MLTNWSIIREPDDKLAETRISIGSAPRGQGIYIVFRGDPDKVLDVLETALSKAREELPRGNYQDKRRRPQG
jgi:hypothetical protein